MYAQSGAALYLNAAQQHFATAPPYATATPIVPTLKPDDSPQHAALGLRSDCLLDVKHSQAPITFSLACNVPELSQVSVWASTPALLKDHFSTRVGKGSEIGRFYADRETVHSILPALLSPRLTAGIAERRRSYRQVTVCVRRPGGTVTVPRTREAAGSPQPGPGGTGTRGEVGDKPERSITPFLTPGKRPSFLAVDPSRLPPPHHTRPSVTWG
ncbi:unnamed protein product [Lota lota]